MFQGTLKLGVNFLLLLFALEGSHGDQATIDYLATYMSIEYHVDNNLGGTGRFDGRIIMENTGSQAVTDLTWSMYVTSLKMFEPDDILPGGADLGQTGLRVYHVSGSLYRVAPSGAFPGFSIGQRLVIPFRGANAQAEATETLPNWYFVADDAEPRVSTSTADETLSWVGAFTTSNQWKRYIGDMYDPYTGPQRYAMYNYSLIGPSLILPTPVEVSLDPGSTVNIGTGDWVVVIGDPTVASEAQFLADALGVVAVDPEFTPSSRYITVTLGGVTDGDDQPVTVPEAYRLQVTVTGESLSITGIDTDGAFNGVQSLISLYDAGPEIPSGFVVDYPRFHYRGMHIDVSRNFQAKDLILRHLDAMALYKLNKFHFHLTDDEGWRLEIPGLPELTEVGGRRCHDLSEDLCILPQLGSAPGLANDGTGFYSVDDYREILDYANTRHIQVIPEFDMPGHCNAPIKAMLARYRKYVDTNVTMATEFLLSDLNDNSDYISIQNFANNSANPCVESTYTFIEHLVREVKAMHQDIQPLTTFNFGGDEVPGGAWVGSPACAAMGSDNSVIKAYFAQRVAQIAFDEGLDVSAWEDGFLDGHNPYDISSMPNANKYAYAWYNVFEWGEGEKAYIMANAGYKTILSPSTHMYFDHPYEPDPYDRGLYWATRICPTTKTFGFQPDDMYANMGDDIDGNPLDPADICQQYGCRPLDPGMDQNIIGLQGQLWSETVRKPEYLDYMIFPRLLALAERAWHKADWESSQGVKRAQLLQQDWERFANTLGFKELLRLDNRGIRYAINPPGAQIAAGNVLEARNQYPGTLMLYSTDGGETYQSYTDGLVMQPGTTVLLMSGSADGGRGSREIQLVVP